MPILGIGQIESGVEWAGNYVLKASDFEAKPPNTGEEQSVYAYCSIAFQANNLSILFGNLNQSVSNQFDPKASWLDSGDETDVLLRYAQTSWDLNEVAARKFRKRLHENRLKLNTALINAYLQEINRENTTILSEYSKASKFGRNLEGHKVWQKKVDSLLQVYDQYCKACKKPKKRKRKDKNGK